MNQTYNSFNIEQHNKHELVDNAIYPLSDNAFISIKGSDAKTFLQGQLSCDLNSITTSQAALGSHSDAKGRMQSSFRICQVADDEYWLKVHHSIAEHALAALKKFSIFSKVTLSILQDVIGIGMHGHACEQELHAIYASFDQSLNQQQHDEYIYLNTDHNAYEIYGSPEKISTIWKQLSKKISSYPPSQLLLLEHKNGLAFVQQATIGEFVAQQFNYQAVGAISFSKGCYTGQEIIARMQYRGKLKRTMQHWQIVTKEHINIGDSICLPEQKKTIGHILSAVNIGKDQWDILLNIEHSLSEQNEYQLQDGHSFSKTTNIELPYSVDI